MWSWDNQFLLLFGITLYTVSKTQDEYYINANISNYCQQQRNPACCKRYPTLTNCSEYKDQSEWTVQTFCDVSLEAWSVCCEMYPHIESCIKYQRPNCSRNDNGEMTCTEDKENKIVQDSNQLSCISDDGKTCKSDVNRSEPNCTCIPMDLCNGNDSIQTYPKFNVCEEKDHLCCSYGNIKSSSRDLDSLDKSSSNNPYDINYLDAYTGTHRNYLQNSYGYGGSYNAPSYSKTKTVYKPFFIPVPSPPQLVYNVERPFIVPVAVPFVVTPPPPIKVIIPPPPSSTIPPPTTTSYTPPYYPPYSPPSVPSVFPYYPPEAYSSPNSYDQSAYLPPIPSYYPSSGTGVPSQYSSSLQPPYQQSFYKSTLPNIPSYYPSTYGLPYSLPNPYNFSPSYKTHYNPSSSYKPSYNLSQAYLKYYVPSQSYNSTYAFTNPYSPSQNLYPNNDKTFLSLEPIYQNSYSNDNKMPQNPYSNENQYENLFNAYVDPNYTPPNSIYNPPINPLYTDMHSPQHQAYLVRQPNLPYNIKTSSDTSKLQMDYNNLNPEPYVNNPPDVNSYVYSIPNFNYQSSTTIIPLNKPSYLALPYDSKATSVKYQPSLMPQVDYNNLSPQSYTSNPPLVNSFSSITNLKYQSSSPMISLNQPPYSNMEYAAYQPKQQYPNKPPYQHPSFNTYQPQLHDYMSSISYESQTPDISYSVPPNPDLSYPMPILVPPNSSPYPPSLTPISPNYNSQTFANINDPSRVYSNQNFPSDSGNHYSTSGKINVPSADTARNINTYLSVPNDFQSQANGEIYDKPLIKSDNIYSPSATSITPAMNPEVSTYSKSITQQTSKQPSNISFTNNPSYLHLSNEFAPNGNTLPNIYLPEQSLHNADLFIPLQTSDVTKYVINPFPSKIHVESDDKPYINNNYPYIKKQFRDNVDIFLEGQTFPILNPELMIINPNISTNLSLPIQQLSSISPLIMNQLIPPTVPSLVTVSSTSLENSADSVFQQTRENIKDVLPSESNIITLQDLSVSFNQDEVNRVCGIRNKLTPSIPNGMNISQFARAMDDDHPGMSSNGVEFPWQVSIFLKNLSYICSGALLDSIWILTAAHCVNRYTPDDLLLQFGIQNMKDLNNGPDVSPILIIIHQDFDPTSLLNDIALIKFQPGVRLNKNINIICPPSLKDYAGKICTVAGWGKNQKDNQLSESLQKIDVPVIPQNQCKTELQSAKGLQKTIILDNRFLCAGAVENTCQGDGGSPLVCSINGKYELIGVVSWGLDCGNIFPGIYTNVQKYLSWITKLLKF